MDNIKSILGVDIEKLFQHIDSMEKLRMESSKDKVEEIEEDEFGGSALTAQDLEQLAQRSEDIEKLRIKNLKNFPRSSHNMRKLENKEQMLTAQDLDKMFQRKKDMEKLRIQTMKDLQDLERAAMRKEDSEETSQRKEDMEKIRIQRMRDLDDLRRPFPNMGEVEKQVETEKFHTQRKKIMKQLDKQPPIEETEQLVEKCELSHNKIRNPPTVEEIEKQIKICELARDMAIKSSSTMGMIGLKPGLNMSSDDLDQQISILEYFREHTTTTKQY